ncbi:hypothetical protein H351_30375 (plasmid) [Rhodococcus erythropolis R138]|nr:hypothetical protein H351_30375 [Rhodococcus erythropolis R138]
MVGSRITVIPTSGSRAGNTELRVGIVSKDYPETVIDNSDLVRDWASVLRRATALDDGRLVLAAEDGLELT